MLWQRDYLYQQTCPSSQQRSNDILVLATLLSHYELSFVKMRAIFRCSTKSRFSLIASFSHQNLRPTNSFFIKYSIRYPHPSSKPLTPWQHHKPFVYYSAIHKKLLLKCFHHIYWIRRRKRMNDWIEPDWELRLHRFHRHYAWRVLWAELAGTKYVYLLAVNHD